MYCAVQSPIPGSAVSARIVASGSAPGSSTIDPSATAVASATSARARAPITPNSDRRSAPASTRRAGVGARRDSAANGVAIGVPRRAAIRPPSRVALATVTC
jgi:hypothetical protein